MRIHISRLLLAVTCCSAAACTATSGTNDSTSSSSGGGSSSSTSSGAVSNATSVATSAGPSSGIGSSAGGSSVMASSRASSASALPSSSAGASSAAGSSMGGSSAAGSSSIGAGSSSVTGASSAGSTSSSSGGVDVCAALSDGPFTPTVFNNTLSGSEDLALDGLGHLAGKDGTQVVLLDAQGAPTVLASGIGTAYGLRFMLGGDLLVALPSAGTIKRITPQGNVTDFATGLSTPNGIFPDLAGNIWVTEFGGSRVVRFASTGGSPTTIASGQTATSANGVVFDPARGLLFFTNYSNGGIKRVPIAQDGTPGSAVLVTTINGNPDGLALDVCGHLYVVDQGNDRVFRVRLDAAGAAVGNPVILATFANNVANAQFGRGTGFSPTSLYLAGNPGTVYALDVGVGGAAIP